MSKDKDLPSAEAAHEIFKKHRPTHSGVEAVRLKLMKKGEQDEYHSRGKQYLTVAKSLQDTHEELFEEHQEPTLSEQYLEWLELNELTSPDTKRCFTTPDGEKICYKGPNAMEKMWDKHKQAAKERESKKKDNKK